MLEEQTTFTFYALSIKGGFYNSSGMVVDDIAAACLFHTKEEAIRFRKFHDPKHSIDCSILLTIQMLVSEIE